MVLVGVNFEVNGRNESEQRRCHDPIEMMLDE